MDPAGCGSGGAGDRCYYDVLGIPRNADSSEVRSAYRKLAMKWHPDRWCRDPKAAAEANRRFQRIQEAYAVLSDDGKRAMYDVGWYDPLEEEDEGFSDFMQEMLSMMDNVKPKKDESFEDLQRMFADLVRGECPDPVGARREQAASDETCKRSSVVGAAPSGSGAGKGGGAGFGSGTVFC